MNQALIDAVSRAVLYEGYILYPYRPCVKSRQRWTLGGIYPEAYAEARGGSERSMTQTECLLSGGRQARLRVKVRFLHLVDRSVGQLDRPLSELRAGAEPALRPVESLQLPGEPHQAWQEAVEREVSTAAVALDELVACPRAETFTFPGGRELEPVRDDSGLMVAVVMRAWQSLSGEVELSASRLEEGLFRVTVRVPNHTPFEHAAQASRDEALTRSMVSAQTILAVEGGEFVSLMDPSGPLRAAADECRNVGTWPVLVGEPAERDAMLSSPVILYDHPRIAPESPGDLFDATEIDELLTLRVLTLTDREKREMSGMDERGRELLARTESLAQDQLARLHGTMRGLRPAEGGDTADGVGGEADVRRPDVVRVAGFNLRAGDRVRLRPRHRADAFDLLLDGKTATIAAIERDYENRTHLAVTVDEDPGADLGRDGKIAHRFFFAPEEVEPLGTGAEPVWGGEGRLP